MCALTWVSRHDAFFWDTVQLGSKHAHFFYENGLKWLPLPAEIDSGHPPVFGYYLALIWTFFGKSLAVSHGAMLPFLLLIVLLLWRIGRRLGGDSGAAWLPAIVLLDPVLLGQSVMISPDVVLVAAFLVSLEGVFGGRKMLLMLGVMGLCAISMRGMMTAAALFAWVCVWPFFRHFNYKKAIGSGIAFVPGMAFGAWFLIWHAQATGWIGYHPGSPWASAFNPVGVSGFFRNIAVLGWRWLDFGRVGEVIVIGWLLFKQTYPSTKNVDRIPWHKSSIFTLLVCLLVFLLPSALLYQNLSAHRYFLPAFIGVHLLVFQLLINVKSALESTKSEYFTRPKLGLFKRRNTGIMVAVVASLALGNFWRYPQGISMDWDSTLAHWPYHRLRADALSYLDSRKIDFTLVGTAFPNINTGENLLLNGDYRQFAGKDFAQNKYILVSNVFNDFSSLDYATLARDWKPIWREQSNAVWMELYERRVY